VALTAILDGTFSSQPMSHWHEVFEQGHITFGPVRMPQQVPSDPQLQVNDEILGELGFDATQIESLHTTGVVPEPRHAEGATRTSL
jgi:hypothetical protein